MRKLTVMVRLGCACDLREQLSECVAKHAVIELNHAAVHAGGMPNLIGGEALIERAQKSRDHLPGATAAGSSRKSNGSAGAERRGAASRLRPTQCTPIPSLPRANRR